MLSYINNGGRLGENISFLYGIFKFCKINDIDFNNIILDVNYKNNALMKNEKSEFVFKENMEMFNNIKYIFRNVSKDFFKDFLTIDLHYIYDISQLNNFYKYNKISKDTNIIFKNWWSLDKYWINRDVHFDLKLLNYICRPVKLSNILYRKYKNILNKKNVAIHIRRGDFLGIKNNELLNDFVINNKEYYFKYKSLYTIDQINKLICLNLLQKKNILIFSDDIEWCKNNFNIYKNVYFPHGKKPYEDIILMSLCDEVIVNEGSSFSNIAYILSKGFHNYV